MLRYLDLYGKGSSTVNAFKKTRQTEEEVGRQHQEVGRPGVRRVPEGNGEQGKMEETV